MRGRRLIPIWALGLGWMIAAPAFGAPIRFAAVSQTTGPSVTLGQIADLSAAPADLRPLAAAIEIASFDKRQNVLVLSTQRLVERIGALMPALTPWLASPAELTIRVARRNDVPPRTPSSEGTCLEVEQAIARGDYPLRRQFRSIDCPAAAPVAALSYDGQARAARAVRDLQPGEIIRAAPLAVLAEVKPGQKVFLRASIGVVTVEREVEVFQPSAAGRAMFVKASDGSLLSAPAPEIVQ